jgi:predicted AAA+ superfamily ATPase
MFARAAELGVRDALADTPVVLVHGPRQTGKSTLAQAVGKSIGAKYLTLDDPLARSLAISDPAGLLAGYSNPVILDEVQRAPQLFLAIKAEVDRDRRPGRFLLTGSANVLSLPKIADSLAGRIAIVDLHPLAQAEIEGSTKNIVDEIFKNAFEQRPGPSVDLAERVVKGGFPEPLGRTKPNRRDAWFADYVRTLLERDVRDLANIEGLAQLPRLLKLLAVKGGSTLNVADLSSETRIPNTSLHRYLDLLQGIFLTFQVPAWSFDEATKLAKTPRTYLVDSGLVCYLRGLNPINLQNDDGVFTPILRGFVATELRKLCSFSETRPLLYHLRTVKRLEVDFVLATRSGEVAGVSVTTSSHVLPEHVEGLNFLRELAGPRFIRGILLYGGQTVQPIGHRLLAVPISALWG